MSMPTPDNPHTVRKNGYELVYWSGNAASGSIGADRVVLYQWAERNVRHHVGEYMLPSQRVRLESIEQALECAFDAGRRAKAAEVRKVLGL